mmetsp:Transcript_129292/g.192570  ORF Transcript_129292/g.192570 Transcript_129292/m.192570 type:complete len:116 (-) Transcript_129292:146-493(-)
MAKMTSGPTPFLKALRMHCNVIREYFSRSRQQWPMPSIRSSASRLSGTGSFGQSRARRDSIRKALSSSCPYQSSRVSSNESGPGADIETNGENRIRFDTGLVVMMGALCNLWCVL